MGIGETAKRTGGPGSAEATHPSPRRFAPLRALSGLPAGAGSAEATHPSPRRFAPCRACRLVPGRRRRPTPLRGASRRFAPCRACRLVPGRRRLFETVAAPALQRAGVEQGTAVARTGAHCRDPGAETTRRDRHSAGCIGAIAELTEEVEAPARNSPRHRYGAGMGAAGGEVGGGAGQAHHGDRPAAQVALARADLAPLVLAPAAQHSGVRNRTAVHVARRDGVSVAAESADRDRNVSVDRRAIAELADRIEPPAVGRAVRSHGAAVLAARRDVGPRAADRNGEVARRVRAVAELAAVVAPPAEDGLAGGQGAGVEAAHGDFEHPAAQAAHRHGRAAARVGAVAELAAEIFAPAEHCAEVGECAGVLSARADRCDAASEPAHRSGGVAGRGGAVPQLSRSVVAPAQGRASVRNRAAVMTPRSDCGRTAGEAADADRIVAGRIGPVAELPERIGAPAADRAGAGECAGVIGPG